MYLARVPIVPSNMHTPCAALADAATLPLCLCVGDVNTEGAGIMVGRFKHCHGGGAAECLYQTLDDGIQVCSHV